mmetsp:Transcript_75937/g.127625  ORF Transcript_75937/g.127625 Transcript_75937/m.127625 type:complete len:365 (-) Transcript_75937:329-1423(-)
MLHRLQLQLMLLLLLLRQPLGACGRGPRHLDLPLFCELLEQVCLQLLAQPLRVALHFPDPFRLQSPEGVVLLFPAQRQRQCRLRRRQPSVVFGLSAHEALVELQCLRTDQHFGGVEGIHLQPLQGPRARQCHVRLPHLEHVLQTNVHKVEGHPLALVNCNGPRKLQGHLHPRGCLGTTRIRPSYSVPRWKNGPHFTVQKLDERHVRVGLEPGPELCQGPRPQLLLELVVGHCGHIAETDYNPPAAVRQLRSEIPCQHHLSAHFQRQIDDDGGVSQHSPEGGEDGRVVRQIGQAVRGTEHNRIARQLRELLHIDVVHVCVAGEDLRRHDAAGARQRPPAALKRRNGLLVDHTDPDIVQDVDESIV